MFKDGFNLRKCEINDKNMNEMSGVHEKYGFETSCNWVCR